MPMVEFEMGLKQLARTPTTDVRFCAKDVIDGIVVFGAHIIGSPADEAGQEVVDDYPLIMPAHEALRILQ